MCEPKYGKVSSHRDLLLLAQLATRRERERQRERALVLNRLPAMLIQCYVLLLLCAVDTTQF